MKHVDWVQIALCANLASIAIVLVTAVVLAWNNTGSRNIPLAAAALIGVMVGYLVQLSFELTRSRSSETIDVEFVIDRAGPSIHRWVYSKDARGMSRLSTEEGASQWLAKSNPSAFEQPAQRERGKLVSDLTMYSLVSYLADGQYDWQSPGESHGS